MNPSPSVVLHFSGVRVAYDMVSEDYAARFRDAPPEAPLDLAMVNEFAESVTAPEAGLGSWTPGAAQFTWAATSPREVPSFQVPLA